MTQVITHPEVAEAIAPPAERDLAWFRAHPDAVVRFRPAAPGELELHSPFRAVPPGCRGGWLAVFCPFRLHRPGCKLLLGGWALVEVPPVRPRKRQEMAELLMELLAPQLNLQPEQALAALRRQFRRRRGFAA